MSNDRNRVSAGSSSGGQYAPEAHDELGDIDLGNPTTPTDIVSESGPFPIERGWHFERSVRVGGDTVRITLERKGAQFGSTYRAEVFYPGQGWTEVSSIHPDSGIENSLPMAEQFRIDGGNEDPYRAVDAVAQQLASDASNVLTGKPSGRVGLLVHAVGCNQHGCVPACPIGGSSTQRQPKREDLVSEWVGYEEWVEGNAPGNSCWIDDEGVHYALARQSRINEMLLEQFDSLYGEPVDRGEISQYACRDTEQKFLNDFAAWMEREHNTGVHFASGDLGQTEVETMVPHRDGMTFADAAKADNAAAVGAWGSSANRDAAYVAEFIESEKGVMDYGNFRAGDLNETQFLELQHGEFQIPDVSQSMQSGLYVIGPESESARAGYVGNDVFVKTPEGFTDDDFIRAVKGVYGDDVEVEHLDEGEVQVEVSSRFTGPDDTVAAAWDRAKQSKAAEFVNEFLAIDFTRSDALTTGPIAAMKQWLRDHPETT